jgi:hypothetical protein
MSKSGQTHIPPLPWKKYRNRPPPPLLSANCQPGCSLPIHLSSLPWLVVVSFFVTLHPPPPDVFTMRRLILSSSCRLSSTYHCIEVPQAFKTPPPLVRLCLRLIVTMLLVTLLPLLVLSTIHRLLSANASPPVGLLFVSWLLCHPCCRAAAASHLFSTLPPPLVLSTYSLPHNEPPPPHNTPPPLVSWHLSSRLPLF